MRLRTRRHTLLARQLLLRRARTDVPRVLEAVGGLQAQYAPSCYLGLWSRLDGFARQDLDDALTARTAVQGTLLRVTIHLVSADDYWPFALAVRRARQRWWLRLHRDRTERELAAVADEWRTRLAGGEIVTANELNAALGRELSDGLGLWLDLVRVPPSGTWVRRRADLLASAESWLGPQPRGLSEERAIEHLVVRYLHGYGPARPVDVADWAGLPIGTVRDALARLPHLAVDGTDLIDVDGVPMASGRERPPVRFLGTWETMLLAHARASEVLREHDRATVFHTRLPSSMNVFLVDGQVAGGWKQAEGGVTLSPFRPLTDAQQHAVDVEARRLTSWLER